ncbi:MAG: PQQ-binding-like beta-propeller repeat protein [Rhizobiaceae bacterium]|nr:PQQ-binding-like beta-propeller repeat protein [Rhizobiaceae bacterium]
MARPRTVRHLVVTVHGIRTHGEWQERLERLADEALRGGARPSLGRPEFVHRRYGFFSIPAFFTPYVRWLQAKRFRRELRNLVGLYPDLQRLDLFCHSFGTYVVVRAIDDATPAVPLPRIGRLVLAGSVLPRDYPWDELVGERVEQVVNECGERDNILFLNRLVIPFLGAAGLLGFQTLERRSFVQRYFEMGHSGYFEAPYGEADEDWFLRKYWLPLILQPTSVAPLPSPPRAKLTALRGIRFFLLNNATIIKASALVGVCLAAAAYFAGLYAETEGQRKLAVARLARTYIEEVTQRQDRLALDDRLMAVESLVRLPEAERQDFLRTVALRLPTIKRSSQSTISRVEVSGDGRIAAIAWGDSILLLDLMDPNRRFPLLKLGEDRPLAMVFDKFGATLAATTAAGVSVFRTGEERPVVDSVATAGPAIVSDDGAYAAFMAADGALTILDVATGETHPVAPSEDGAGGLDPDPYADLVPVAPGDASGDLHGAAFAEGGRIVAVVGSRRLVLADAATGRVLSSHDVERDVLGLKASSDGSIVAVRHLGDGGGKLTLFDLSAGRFTAMWQTDDAIGAFELSPDGSRFYFADSLGAMQMLMTASLEVKVLCGLDLLQGEIEIPGGYAESAPPAVNRIVMAPGGLSGIALTSSYYKQMRIVPFDSRTGRCEAAGQSSDFPLRASFVDEDTAFVLSDQNMVDTVELRSMKVLARNPHNLFHDIQASPASRMVVFGEEGVVKAVPFFAEGLVEGICGDGSAMMSSEAWSGVFGQEERRATCPPVVVVTFSESIAGWFDRMRRWLSSTDESDPMARPG